MSIPISVFLCMLFTMITGTIAYLIFKIVRKVNKDTKVLKVHYIVLKVVVFAFFIPVSFLLELLDSYNNGGWHNTLFLATPALHIIAVCLLLVWLVGLMVYLFKWFLNSNIHRKQIKTYQDSDKYDEVLNSIKKRMGVERQFQVQVGDYYESPFCTGILKPRICLPDYKYSEKDLELLFMHELTHYKHRDLCFLTLIKILELIHWFHPVFRKNRLYLQYRELMEDACDIDVCKQVSDYKCYVQVLLRMILKSSESKIMAPVFLSESYEDVIRRIDNMKTYMEQRLLKRIVVTCLIAAVFCGSSLAVYAAENGVVEGYNKAYDVTWQGMEEEMNGITENTLVEVYEKVVEDDSIAVEYVLDNSTAYSSTSLISYALSANTEKRKASTIALQEGDKVLVSLTVDPADKNVKVGFYMSNGYVRYITGSGDIYHTFTIYDDDNYRFFVQNNNSVAVEVDGYYSVR